MGEIVRHLNSFAFQSVVLQVEAVHVLGISFEDVKSIDQIHVRHLVRVDHGEGLFDFRAAPPY